MVFSDVLLVFAVMALAMMSWRVASPAAALAARGADADGLAR